MIAIVTVLIAFPLGLLVRDRRVAVGIYLAAYLYCFTFQSAYLVRGWVLGDDTAFRRPADYSVDYLAVSLLVLAVGVGLVLLGGRVAVRRRRRATGVDLDAR